MRCEQIMERQVEHVSPETTVVDAAKCMRDEDIGFLPVCDASGKAIGALTDRDIAVRVVAEGKPLTAKVSDVLTKEVVACKPQDSLDVAEKLMKDHKKQRLMVCDDSGKLVGVISLQDLSEASSGKELGSTVKSIKSDGPTAAH